MSDEEAKGILTSRVSEASGRSTIQDLVDRLADEKMERFDAVGLSGKTYNVEGCRAIGTTTNTVIYALSRRSMMEA